MIVALMSTYREGRLALSAARSVLAGVDALVLYEGAVGTAAAGGDLTPIEEIRTACEQAGVGFWHEDGEHDQWATDAAKRTSLLEFAHDLDAEWCVWIDGDEVMLWSEYLPDYTARAGHEGGAGGFAMRIVEMDGSVALAHGRVFRGDLVEAFEESSYQARLRSGLVVALPNEPICVAGGVPAAKPGGDPVTVDDLQRLRPPLAGEPHILHRTTLRSPERQARRLHDDEPAWFDKRDPTRRT